MKPWTPLPSSIDYMDWQVRKLARVAAVLTPCGAPAAPGSTRSGGLPDVPEDASWRVPEWDQSYHDGEAFVFQLNLAEIPAQVRRPLWPTTGVVWVFLDLSDAWTVRIEFDPRPAEQIPWPPVRQLVRSMHFGLFLSPPYASEEHLPEVHWVPENDRLYSDWVHDQVPRYDRVVVGGWIQPIQGVADGEEDHLVAELGNLHFGDCGAVYLLFDPEKQRWYGYAQTA